MNCQSVQEQMQQLLDSRSTAPIPVELQGHLNECTQCQLWQALFHAHPVSISSILPAEFATKTLYRYSREQRRHRWFRNSSLLALAAAMLVAVLTWAILNQPQTDKVRNNAEQAQLDPQKVINDLRQDYIQIKGFSERVATLNVSFPSSLPSWELRDFDDPLTMGMPAIRTIGTTLQGAVEPYGAPAKAAIQKVKSLVDDPEVKKWVDNVRKRLT